MVYVADETPDPSPTMKPRSTQRGKTRSAGDQAFADAARRMNEIAESPAAKAASESINRLTADFNRIADSPTTKALSDALKQGTEEASLLAEMTQVSESMKRLTEIAQPSKSVEIPPE